MALITSTDLATALSITEEIADRLHPVALELVSRYSPDAPEAIRSEAIIRTSGWLAEQPMAAIRDEKTGDVSTAYATNNLSALRHSGAMALLSPWRVRRAGVIC